MIGALTAGLVIAGVNYACGYAHAKLFPLKPRCPELKSGYPRRVRDGLPVRCELRDGHAGPCMVRGQDTYQQHWWEPSE